MEKNLWKFLYENKDWLFSGIGITLFTIIIKFIYGLSTKRNSKIKNSDKAMRNDNISIVGDGNIIGDGNIVNYYEKNPVIKQETLFSQRYSILKELLNDSRDINEKEYTDEYICLQIGLDNVNELNRYLQGGIDPDKSFKRKFVDVFGVNADWMVSGQGNGPFLSNIILEGKSAMMILFDENLSQIKQFIIVVGYFEGWRYACVVREKTNLCYEIYPYKYSLNTNVGLSDVHKLTDFYRFMKEANNIKKLHSIVYEATNDQFINLLEGKIAPKKVKKFEVFKFFIDDFLDLSPGLDDLRNRFWESDLLQVHQMIMEDYPLREKINGDIDRERIYKLLCFAG